MSRPGDEFGPESLDSPIRKTTITLTTMNKHLGLKKEDQIHGREIMKKCFMDEHREGNQKGLEKNKIQANPASK